MDHSDHSSHMGHHDFNPKHAMHSEHKMPPLNLSDFGPITPSVPDNVAGYGANLMESHAGHAGHDAASAGAHAGHQMSGEHMMHGEHMMSGDGHMMSMTFHGGVDETILFSWWKVTEAGEFVGSFFAIFLMALLYEGLKYYRKHLLWKTYNGLQYCAVAPPDKGVANICAPDEPQVIRPTQHALEPNVPTMLSRAHAWQTALHGVQVLVSYMLMLVFMTYNTWLCAAVVLGSATGYFLFGWRESVVVDFTEHCH